MKSLLLTYLLLAATLAAGQSAYLLPQEIEAWFQADTTPWKDQKAGWMYTYVGEFQKALEIWDSKRGGRRPMDGSDSTYFARFHPVEAVSYIAKAAADRQVVIINEAHHQPRHRVFTTRLLRALYDEGFRYLALEDLSYTDSLLQQRKFPISTSGFYVVEPRLGNLVRQALAIGYTLWPYEYDGSGEREVNQARNLARLFDRDKQAKVLVHCGFDHVIEGKHPYWDKAMAGWFKELTGIDPLTISQVQMTERSRRDKEDPHYNMTRLPWSSVFVDSLGQPFSGRQGANQYDIELFHPHTVLMYGRPDWLLEDSGKKWVSIKGKKIQTGFPCLIEARLRQEGAAAIPVDVVVCNTVNEIPRLALFPGKYDLSIRDGNKQVQHLRLNVKN